MELKRRVGARMSLVLLFLGSTVTAAALVGQNLDCTNDLDESMFCEFEAQNCTEYNLTLRINDSNEEVHCIFEQRVSGRCCCNMQMILVSGETHTATVWKGGESMGSKTINITDGIKPRVPTIVSVNESNGNFQVVWKTNMRGVFSDTLVAHVTYHEKGDTAKVSKTVTPTKVSGFNNYEILGRHLKPSTTYMVSVKSYSDWSDRYSDSSAEWEFTTSASPDSQLVAVIISLSIIAIITSGAIYFYYVKLKTKWWDKAAKCTNPKFLNVHPTEQKVLKPVPLNISTVYVEPPFPDDSKSWSKYSLMDSSCGSPQHSSGISTGSSCLSYANTEPVDIKASVQDALGKVFINISLRSPLTISPFTENKDSGLFSAPITAEDTSSGSTCIENKTYFILIPGVQHQSMTDSSEVQKQAEMLCDSPYHPSEGDVCPDQKVPACLLVDLPPVDSSPMPTDMSYQQCNADAGKFSNAEDSSSLSSTSSGTNTIASCDHMSRVEAGCESSDEVVGGATKLSGEIKSDKNPCYGSVPASSCSFPPVDYDYQAFRNLVEQPDILFSEKRSVEEEEHLSKYPEESFTKMPQSLLSPVVPGFNNNVQVDQCLSECQRPLLSLISVDKSMPVITDSGYQCV